MPRRVATEFVANDLRLLAFGEEDAKGNAVCREAHSLFRRAGFDGIAQDVTAQRILERQFQQAQRLEAGGRLAGRPTRAG